MCGLSENSMRATLLLLPLFVSLLCGCGAEVAGSAATAAKLQASQAQAVKAQEEQFKKQLSEALKAGEAAASAADAEK